MTCEDVRQELVAHLAGELGSDFADAIDGHLSGCRSCREERAGLAATGALLDDVLATPEVVPSSSGRPARLEEAAWGRRGEASSVSLGASLGDRLGATPSVRGGGRPSSAPGRRPARSAGRSAARAGRARPGRIVALGAAAVVGFSLFLALSQGRLQEDLRLTSLPPAAPEDVMGEGSERSSAAGEAPAQPFGRAELARAEVAPAGSEVVAEAPAGADPAIVGAAERDSTSAPAVPEELRENPDMFLDFVIVRRLEKLRRLPELLADTRASVEEAG